MNGALPKCQRTIREMLGGALPVTDEVEWKEKDQLIKVVDFMEPAASTGLVPRVVEALRNVQEVM